MKKNGSTFAVGLIGSLIIALIAVIVIGTARDKKLETENIAKAQANYQKLLKQEADIKAQKEEQARQNKIKGVGHTIRYAAIGDNLTVGYYATSPDKTYTSLIGFKAKDRMGFDMVTSQYAEGRSLLSWGITQVAKVNEEKPNLITIEFGTNDADLRYSPDILLFETQLNSLIDGLTINTGYNPEIVLVTTWARNTTGDQCDAIIKKVGSERHISVADISSAKFDPLSRGPAGRDTYLGKSDDIHPNDNGMEQISEAIYRQVEPLLIKLVDDKKV